MGKRKIFRIIMRIIRCIACIFCDRKCPREEMERDEEDDDEEWIETREEGTKKVR